MADEIVAASIVRANIQSLKESVENFNKSSSRLSRVMILLAVAAIGVTVSGLIFDFQKQNLEKENLSFSVYKELSYNKGIIDMISKKEDNFKTKNYVFFRDFQFESYRALLKNFSFRGQLAENIMDSYRRMGIMQKSIEQARMFPADSITYHQLVLQNINEGLVFTLQESLKGLKELYGFDKKKVYHLPINGLINWTMFFSIVGILCVFGGTFVLSRNLLLKGLKKEALEKLIKDNKPIHKIYRIIAGKMFGLKGDPNLLVLFDPTNMNTIRLEKQSVYEPIRGILWIILGIISQVIGITGFNINLVIILSIMIVSVPGTYLFLILKDYFKK